MELRDHDADAVEERARRPSGAAATARSRLSSTGSIARIDFGGDELPQVGLLAADAALVVLELRHRPLEAVEVLVALGGLRAERVRIFRRRLRPRRRLRRGVVASSCLRGQASSNHCLILVKIPFGVSLRRLRRRFRSRELLEERLLRGRSASSAPRPGLSRAGRRPHGRGRPGALSAQAEDVAAAACRRGPSSRPCRRASGSRAWRRARACVNETRHSQRRSRPRR